MKTPRKHGGPAFPIKGYCADASGALAGEVVEHPGMSLRDYFAGRALAGWLASYGPDSSHPTEADTDGKILANIAQASYKLADAMIKERNAP